MELISWVAKYWIEFAFGIICAAQTCGYKGLSAKIKKRSSEESATREATLALLDDGMGRLFTYCKEKGYATREEARRYERMYQAYHGLGGNGAVTNEHDQFKRIEISDEGV